MNIPPADGPEPEESDGGGEMGSASATTANSGMKQVIDGLRRIDTTPTGNTDAMMAGGDSEGPLQKGSSSKKGTHTVASKPHAKEAVSDRKAASAAKQGAPPKKRAKKPWKKPEGMPKRPLSAYNIFFRLQRQQLLGEEVAKEFEITDQSKRKHRKTHGKIGFAEMARLISEKWKTLGESKRQSFVDQAKVEKERYDKELFEWKQKTTALVEEEQDFGESVSTGLPPSSEAYNRKPSTDTIRSRDVQPQSQLPAGGPYWGGGLSVNTSSNSWIPRDRQMEAAMSRLENLGHPSHPFVNATALPAQGHWHPQFASPPTANALPAGMGTGGQGLASQAPSSHFGLGGFQSPSGMDLLGESMRGSASVGVNSLGGSLRGVPGEASARRNMLAQMNAMGGSLRGVPGEVVEGRYFASMGMDSMDTSLRGGFARSEDQGGRLQRLQQLYSLHLAEAASLREELGRAASSSSTTHFPNQNTLPASSFENPGLTSSESLELARADLLALERVSANRQADAAVLRRHSAGVSPSQAHLQAMDAMEAERARQLERHRNMM